MKKDDLIKKYFFSAMEHFYRGEYQESITDYDRALSLNPSLADAHYNKGNALANLGEYQNALYAYDRAIEFKPDDAQSYANKGISYFILKEYQKAITAYNTAIKLAPEQNEVYYNLTEAYIFSKAHEKALLAINDFLKKEQNPYIIAKDREAWLNALANCPKSAATEELCEIIKSLPDK